MYPYHPRQFSFQIPGLPQFGVQIGIPPFGSPYQPTPPGYGPGTNFGGFPGQVGPPVGPPPSEIPPAQSQGQFGIFAVDPGAIQGCLYRFTYIRLDNGRSFWFYPIFVGRRSVAGYRWLRRQYRWEYFGIDLERIVSFSCR